MANVLGELFGNIAAAIREKTGDTATMKPAEFPDNIRAIETGGGSSDDVRYVTFMSYDGTEEHGRLPVAVGYDCPNPKFTVTRESTAQYDFVHDAWATEPNGTTDANALKAVTEDRTVYATFTAVLRYYTITYLDTDGSVLKTDTLLYGSMPEYTPEKSGYFFNGWTPKLATVTGDASYTATWTETVTFATSSWADIARVSEAGEAEQYFKLGDTRNISIGSGKTLTFEIIGFNHDNLSNGTGKAGLTIATKTVLGATENRANKTTYMNTIISSGFPSELRERIKIVKKKFNTQGAETTAESAVRSFFLSASEINITSCYDSLTGVINLGEPYAYYLQNTNNVKHKRHGGGTAYYPYWLRDWNTKVVNTGSSADKLGIYYPGATTYVQSCIVSANHELVFGFCI